MSTLADCSEYLELISRSIDGDLTSEEAETLYEHLAHCPKCSETLSSFEELSMMTADTVGKPPAELRTGVMESIKAAKKRPWYVRYRFTAVAACFALVVLAISYTPLGDFLFPAQNETVLSDRATSHASEPESAMHSTPSTTMRAAETPEAGPTDKAQTAKSAAPEAKEEAASPAQGSQTEDSAVSDVQESDAENAPMQDAVEENTAGTSGADASDTESFPQDTGGGAGGAITSSFDPSLLPHTPYEKNFAKYLTFSAKEAPAVLHSITSDQTVDHTVYYIVSAEQFTAVQSALLEAGIEVQVIPGDPNASESLLVLTIEE